MNKLVKNVLLGALALGISVVGAAPAAAQDGRGELGIGYQYINFGDGADYPLGFNVDYAWPLGTNNLDIVIDFGWSRQSEEAFGFEVTSNLINAGGGVRWSPVLDAPVAPYVQAIVGIQRTSFSENLFDTDESFTDLMVQPGVGVSFPLNDMWDVFGQVDFRQVFFEDESDMGIRFVVGGRIGL